MLVQKAERADEPTAFNQLGFDPVRETAIYLCPAEV